MDFLESILFKTIFVVFPPVTCWRMVGFCVNNKKEVFVAEENSGLHKRELFSWIFSMNLFHKYFSILVSEGSLSIMWLILFMLSIFISV